MISDHDHVGHMVYEDREARCTDPSCGQAWWLQVQHNDMGDTRCRWIPRTPKTDPW